MQWWRETSGSCSAMSAPSRPTTTRGLESLWEAPLPGPEIIVRITFWVAGRLAPLSCCRALLLEPGESPRANDGNGEITMVALGLRLVSTMVFMPHLAQ